MARSRSALLTLAAIAALAGCCVCAPQGSVQGGVQGGAQVPPGVPHSTAPPAGVGGVRRYHNTIQSVFQRARVSGLAHSRRSHTHQFALAQSTATWHPETARKRRGVYSIGTAHRVRDRGGGMLVVRQLLVAGARRHTGGRVTRGGGRVHARVAPAVSGCGRGPGQPLGRRLPVAGVAAAGAAARAGARLPARRDAPLPGRVPLPPL